MNAKSGRAKPSHTEPDSDNAPSAINATRSSSHKIGQKQIAFLILVAITLLVAYLLVISSQQQRAKNRPSPNTVMSIEDQKKIVNNSNPSSVVATYGKSQDAVIKEVKASNPQKWDRTMLDKAYFSLLYYDKIGDFTDANLMLAMITAAQKSGLNVDNNSFGITEQQRKQIQSNALVLMQKQKGQTSK